MTNTFEQWTVAGVCSPTVRIIAFQAIDPGSTPGRRIGNTYINFFVVFEFYNLFQDSKQEAERIRFYFERLILLCFPL